jgi:uncharacterized protein
MTKIQLVRGVHGEIRSCRAEGHAEYSAKGTDIVCAAVTILLRTAMQVLSATDGVAVTSDTSLRGSVFFSVRADSPGLEISARLICAGDFLEAGLCSLSGEYPGNIEFRKQTEA